MSTEFKIVSDVPIPVSVSTAYSTWPFGAMKVGDSFFVSADLAGPAGTHLRPAVSWWKRRHPGFFYVTRKVSGGYRVWRVAETFDHPASAK